MNYLKKLFGLITDSNNNTETNNQEVSNSSETNAEMSENYFWAVIQSAVDLSDGSYYEIYYKLDDLLNKMEADEVLRFQNTYNRFIINGCNSKMYGASRLIYPAHAEVDWNELQLRELLESIIARGLKFYQDTIENPDNLALLEDIEFGSEIHDMTQDVLYNKGVGYENKFTIDQKLIDQIKIEEEEITQLLPLLWAKYLPEKLEHLNEKNKVSSAFEKLKEIKE